MLAQYIAHPSWHDNGQSHTMRSIIVGIQDFLNTVTRPAAVRIAQRQNVVAAIGTAEHHLGTSGIVFGVSQAFGAVHHQTSQHRLTKAVVEQSGLVSEVLLHHMDHGIGTACGCLQLGYGEGIYRIEN